MTMANNRGRRAARPTIMSLVAAVVLTACPADPTGPGVPASPIPLTVGFDGRFGSVGVSDEANENVGVSLDGNIVAFVSAAPDLAAGDPGPEADVYVRDRAAGTTVRIAEAWPGLGPLVLAGVGTDGRFVAYSRSSSGVISVYDRTTHSTASLPNVGRFMRLADSGNYGVFGSEGGDGYLPACVVVSLPDRQQRDCDPGGTSEVLSAVSANGRFAALTSTPPGGAPQPVVVDLVTGVRRVLPANVIGEHLNEFVSNDGTKLVSTTTALVAPGPKVVDVASGTIATSPLIAAGYVGVDIAPDGNRVALYGIPSVADGNTHSDMYVWNVARGTVTRTTADVALDPADPRNRHQPVSMTVFVANGTRMLDITLGALDLADTNNGYDAYLISVP